MKKMNQEVIAQQNFDNGRIYGLDLLRIFLALLVFMFHSQMHYGCNYSFLNDFVKVGAIAMTGFMMLSGFVLYMSYSRRNFSNINEIRTFYLKRLISVLPLYYSIAFIHVVYQIFLGKISLLDVAILFPVELFSVQSTYFSLFSHSHNGGTWFISCLLICYAAYPYLQFLISQISNRARLFVFFVISGLLLYAPIVRIYFDLDAVTIYANPFYRLLEFMIGIILAQVVCSGSKSTFLSVFVNPISLIITFSFMIISISVIRHNYPINDYMLFNWIVLPCFLIIILNLALIPFKQSRIIKYLSSIAFTFFLCQVLPLWSASRVVCDFFQSDSNSLKIAISLVICFGGAVLIHEGIERPASRFLKMKLLK